MGYKKNRFPHSDTRPLKHFPRIERKKIRKQLWDEYTLYTKEDDQRIKKSTFYEIAKRVTSSDKAILKAIDYVSTILVNEPIEVLQDILSKMVDDSSTEFDTIQSWISIAKNFLKHQYTLYIDKTDSDICFHGINYALSKPGTLDDRSGMCILVLVV